MAEPGTERGKHAGLAAFQTALLGLTDSIGNKPQTQIRGRGRFAMGAVHIPARSRRSLTRQILDYGAGSDSVAFEPALVYQKGADNGVGKARDRCLVMRLHRADLDDFAIRLDKGDRERDRGIFHPERNSLRRWKDKKHAGVFGERLPEAQTFRLFRSSFG